MRAKVPGRRLKEDGHAATACILESFRGMTCLQCRNALTCGGIGQRRQLWRLRSNNLHGARHFDHSRCKSQHFMKQAVK